MKWAENKTQIPEYKYQTSTDSNKYIYVCNNNGKNSDHSS